VSAPGFTLAEAKPLLLAMAAEADGLKRVLGGSVTEALADWLASQYALAARERLAGAKDAERWETLRAFVQDWAALRRGDQHAEWLQIERERLQLAQLDSTKRFKNKLTNAMEALQKYCAKHPKADAALLALAKQVRGPFDEAEGAP
jgi:predicted nucleic acid-binding protein